MSKFELPSQFDNFTVIAERFREYKNEHFYYITAVFIFAYLYKQTFAIPGSFLLVSLNVFVENVFNLILQNIIAGSIFDMWKGFALVCFLTTCGSTLCYLFSEMFGREYVFYYFGERLTYLQQKVNKLESFRYI